VGRCQASNSDNTPVKATTPTANEVVVGRNREGNVVGFATALTDYQFAAYIPLVEVLPENQRKGIASQMVKMLLDRLCASCMIDLVCDDVVPFYERLGGTRLNAVASVDCGRCRGGPVVRLPRYHLAGEAGRGECSGRGRCTLA
jgi:GNAT superfamily N-acetyltransferase